MGSFFIFCESGVVFSGAISSLSCDKKRLIINAVIMSSTLIL